MSGICIETSLSKPWLFEDGYKKIGHAKSMHVNLVLVLMWSVSEKVIVSTNCMSQFWKNQELGLKSCVLGGLGLCFLSSAAMFFVPTLGWVHRIWYLQTSCTVTSLRFNISRKATESTTRSLSKLEFFAHLHLFFFASKSVSALNNL